MNDDVISQSEMETAQMSSEKKMKSQFCYVFQLSVEGSVFVTGFTGGSAVNMEKFFGGPKQMYS